MAIEREAGRRRTDGGLGYPKGCSALSAKLSEPCEAAFRGAECLLCRRRGSLPMPVEFPWAAFNIIGARSIQIIRHKPGVWLVCTFLFGTWLDPVFPVVACRSRQAGVDLAMARARQLEPFAPIKQHGEGDWRMGRIFIWTLGDE